jgi:glycogen(starch) synthase
LRIAIVTWEYPPRIVSDSAIYAQTLSQILVASSFEVHIVTFHEYMRGTQNEGSNIYVHRVGNPVHTHINVLTWDLTLSCEFERACANIQYDIGAIDLIDCHEWHPIVATTTLSKTFSIPFILTLESLEEHRSNFGNSPLNLAIKGIERIGTSEAHTIVVSSPTMKAALQRLHKVNQSKINVVVRDEKLNGVKELYTKLAMGGIDD